MDAAADAEFSDFTAGRWSALVRLGYGLTGDVQMLVVRAVHGGGKLGH